MKWKLTIRYLISILSIVFIVSIVNTVILIALLLSQHNEDPEDIIHDTGKTLPAPFIIICQSKTVFLLSQKKERMH